MLKHYRTVLFIGIIEILIGGITLIATFWSIAAGTNIKPLNVLFFVIVAACISTLLGIGFLKYKKLAYQLLFYFSSFVFLTKILIFLGIFQLSGSLDTTIPATVKDACSVLYHGFIIYFLQKDEIQEAFHIK